jgi:hypothetical protein
MVFEWERCRTPLTRVPPLKEGSRLEGVRARVM